MQRESPGLYLKVKAYLRRRVSADARGHARRWILATPVLSHLYYLIDPVARAGRLHRGSAIVIDGFPRCANTFAVESFRLANPGLSVAHHQHDRRRIRSAVRWKLPVILVVREPDGCVNSFANAIPGTSVDFFHTEYAKFYEGLLDVLPDVVVADFAETTASWPTIIDRCNDRFGTTFRAPAPGARDEILQLVDEYGKSHGFGQDQADADHFERVVSRPSDLRFDACVAELAGPEVRRRALDVYSRVIGFHAASSAR